MKKEVEFTCECDQKTILEIKQPLVGVGYTIEFKCPFCHSLFEFRAEGKIRGIEVSQKLLRKSPKLDEFLRKKKQHELANAPQKKSPIFIVPELARRV